MSRPKKIFKPAVAFALISALGIWGGTFYYNAEVLVLGENLARVVAAPVMGKIHEGDADYVLERVKTYDRGVKEGPTTPKESWEAVSRLLPGLRFRSAASGRRTEIPFVYQEPSAPHLKELVDRYPLADIAGRGDEYQRMLRLFGWIGTRWDHGVDPVPGGNQTFRPAEVIAAGESGSRFWCETAARVTVHAATALGWPARLVTASKDGYQWHHALAEVWSNQFGKWFLVDTDYNILYESGGVPLSGFELCHLGPRLRKEGRLKVRRIAPLKASLKEADLLPFYRYVHIDLRNDWVTRQLPAGSPAGGDLSTWWTARDDLGHLLTAKTRVDDPAIYDWPVNWVEIYTLALAREKGGGNEVKIGLRGYAPYFRAFALRQDKGEWQERADGIFEVTLHPGQHTMEARIITENGQNGPSYYLNYSLN